MKLRNLGLVVAVAMSAASFNVMADNTGTVKFVGSVVNTPCNIEQSSLNQTVDFGQLSKKALETGSIAEANFDIKFTGCDFTTFGKDIATGDPVPAKSMNMVFTGQNYTDNTKALLATSTGNTNNLGVAIDGFVFGTATDVLPRIINQKGDNTLTFKALAKAADANKDVVEGQFSAISNFRITYQ